MAYKRLQLHRDIIWAGIVPDRLCKLIRDGITDVVVVPADKLALAAGTVKEVHGILGEADSLITTAPYVTLPQEFITSIILNYTSYATHYTSYAVHCVALY